MSKVYLFSLYRVGTSYDLRVRKTQITTRIQPWERVDDLGKFYKLNLTLVLRVFRQLVMEESLQDPRSSVPWLIAVNNKRFTAANKRDCVLLQDEFQCF